MATIGPSIHDVEMLESLLSAGMCAGRVDLTWGRWALGVSVGTGPVLGLIPKAPNRNCFSPHSH